MIFLVLSLPIQNLVDGSNLWQLGELEKCNFDWWCMEYPFFSAYEMSLTPYMVTINKTTVLMHVTASLLSYNWNPLTRKKKKKGLIASPLC